MSLAQTKRLVHPPSVTIVDSVGPALVILPSYGRVGGEDFDETITWLAHVGWAVLRSEPGSVADSTEPMAGQTLHDLADDVVAVVQKPSQPDGESTTLRMPCFLSSRTG